MPVISSDLPPVREIAGDTIEMVADITNEADWAAAAINAMVNPAGTASKAENAARRAGSYTWDGVGRDLRDVLRRTSLTGARGGSPTLR